MKVSKKIAVPVNVPYLMGFVKESGLSKTKFSTDVLFRNESFINNVIVRGAMGKGTAYSVARTAGADLDTLLTPVDYDPQDYMLRKGNTVSEADDADKKNSLVEEYISLMSANLVDLAKNQNTINELVIATSKVNADNRQLLNQLVKSVGTIAEKIDIIYAALK